MKLLVLGGTQFVSYEVAAQAVARGWDVTCACRGQSGTLPDGVTHLYWDRQDEAPAAIAEQRWDAVVDVARLPSFVRRALAVTPGAHWAFVSTVNVYADNSSPLMEPLIEPAFDDIDPVTGSEDYGAMKVACELLVTEQATSSVIARPGLIAGAGDPSGRFAYWPHRLARGGEVLAPGSPQDLVQVLDVRDLATWLLDTCASSTTGTFDLGGHPVPFEEMLTEVAAGVGAGVGAQVELTWVDADFLAAHGVEPWSGADALPLWLPRPDYDGMVSHDSSPAIAAGLSLRPVADTALASLGAPPVGISIDREEELLRAWHGRT